MEAGPPAHLSLGSRRGFAYAKAVAAGAASESVPEDKPYGHRNAGVIDQNGMTWWIGAPVREWQT